MSAGALLPRWLVSPRRPPAGLYRCDVGDCIAPAEHAVAFDGPLVGHGFVLACSGCAAGLRAHHGTPDTMVVARPLPTPGSPPEPPRRPFLFALARGGA